MPNNINYYFMRNKLPVLKFFIGPALLMPIALTGFLLFIIFKSCYKKESILFLYILAFGIPICIFFPLGRYKLALAPVFCISASYAIVHLYQLFNKQGNKLHKTLVASLLAGFFFFNSHNCSLP